MFTLLKYFQMLNVIIDYNVWLVCDILFLLLDSDDEEFDRGAETSTGCQRRAKTIKVRVSNLTVSTSVACIWCVVWVWQN